MANGFINLDKPEGMSSHEAVMRVRRVTGMSQIGHAGTLDPAASGVLPIAVGECTRLLPYLSLNSKVYRAQVEVGTLTHSGDRVGRVVARSDPRVPSVAAIVEAGHWLSGAVWQIPPQVSALKSGGKRHYRTVRQGGVVWPAPRRAQITALDEIAVTEVGWNFRAAVSSGTYIRALARDWGFLLGAAVHLCGLARVSAGDFRLEDAVSLSVLEESGPLWPQFLDPWDKYLPLPRYRVEDDAARRIAHGDKVGLLELADKAPGVVALVHHHRLVALAEGVPWRYRAVFGEGI